MPQSEPVTILLINDTGEEIKLVTLSFRGFFPGCRVEAVYSLDEALQWASRAEWHLMLIDERLLAQRSAPVLPELRRLAPSAAIVLQTDRSDSATAVNALQAGADFLLYKKSPAFLTELVLYTKDAMEKRELRIALERTKERHERLVDTLVDVLYELDAEGRFVYLSPAITPLLGYAPEELTGQPYSKVLPPDQLDLARYRFNDRRTGTRASRRIEVELVPKEPREGRAVARIRMELSAKGLYDSQRHFLGTLGLLRDISRRHEHEQTIQGLQQQLREADRLADMTQRVSVLAKQLQAPLATVLSQSQQLFAVIQEVKLDHQVESLLQQAKEAVRQGEELAHTVREAGAKVRTMNDVLDAVLATTQPPLLNTDRVERQYASNLPPFAGNLELTSMLLRILISHVQRYLAAIGSHHQIRISTAAIASTGVRLGPQPVLFPAITPVEVEIRIDETERVVPDHEAPAPHETSDLFQAYGAIHQLGGRLDFHAPVGGLLSITVWLPVEPRRIQPPPAALPSAPVPLPPAQKSSSDSIPAKTIPRDLPAISPAAVSSVPDRRGGTRVSVHLPARITVGNATCEGTVTNLSLGGAGLAVEGLLPSLEDQPAYVVLKTAAGMLELQALAQSRGTFSAPGSTEPPSTLLALRFTSENEMEQNVLASLLDEARARTLAVTVEALLSLPEGLTDVPAPVVDVERRGTDHRESLRVRVALPVRIETLSLDIAAQRPLGLVVNLSRGGACLQMKQVPCDLDDVMSLHFSSTESLGHPRAHEPEAPEAVLAARIVWTSPDHTAPSELRPSPSEPAVRIGIRFVQLAPFAEREINRVIAQHVGSSMDLEGITGRSSIVSARRECRNARQQIIAVTDDHARHQISPTTPVVIVVPGFGKTQTDYLPLSFFLAANRLRVLRYDHTNHVGQSDGDVLQTTLRSMQVDLQNVLEFARTTWPTAPLTVLAEDFGARVALKVMSLTRTKALLLLVNPVFDVQAALTAIYRHDVVTDYQQGLRRGVANLWGLNVTLDQLVSDALAGEYATLSSSATDLAALTEPPLVLTTRRSADDLSDSLASSLRGLGSTLAVIPLHTEVSLQSTVCDERHAATFNTIFKEISATLSGERRPLEFREAPLRDIQRQQALEHERIRIRHHVSQATRDALWIAHLAQLPQLCNAHDYWALREELYRQLLPLEPGMTVLDVGCGQGDLARVILTNQGYRAAHQSGLRETPIHYIGLEQSPESLMVAERDVGTFVREFASAFSAALPVSTLLDTHWLPLDWAAGLPSQERPLTRIVYHLSLSFCPSPLAALRQAIQALPDEGTILVTCFQPHTDFSTLFRRHLQTAGQDQFTAPGQVVLHYLGRIREAIRHGLLHCYEREELAQLLSYAGAAPLRVLPILDGQLLLAVARKGKSTG